MLIFVTKINLFSTKIIMYYNKYLKYTIKNSNLKQTGGGDTVDVVKFIKNSNIDDIEIKLLDIIKNEKYCVKILGEGNMGSVLIFPVGNTSTIKVGNKSITVPVVVKYAKTHDEIYFDVIENILYIYAYQNITMEALILSYTNKLWYKKKTPHLPFMIGYSACVKDKYISHIVTEKHGLDTNVKIQKNIFDINDLLYPAMDNSGLFISHINTLGSLFDYICLQKKGKKEKITLPNGIKCDFVKLFDYICISYIHTHNLLQENNIYMCEIHIENIFIHWLGANSYMGDKHIGDTKNIIYKIKNKKYRIETFGFIIKVGDLGSGIVTPKKNIVILGQGNDMEKNHTLLDTILQKNYLVNYFILHVANFIPRYLLQQSVIQKIVNTYPYNNVSMLNEMNKNQTRDLLTPKKLLDFYSDYQVNEIDDESLVVEEK